MSKTITFQLNKYFVNQTKHEIVFSYKHINYIQTHMIIHIYMANCAVVFSLNVQALKIYLIVFADKKRRTEKYSVYYDFYNTNLSFNCK